MCGHVGVAGDLKFKDEALLKRLLLFDFLRGEDGTGLAAVRNTGEVKVAKCGTHPLELFDTKRFNEALNAYSSKAFIGHNRAATRGVKNSYNAHPYEFGRIVGAHNGTLDNSCTKELEDLLDEKFEVDSMAIFAAMDKLGVEDTIPLLSGAWSLVWYDKDDKTLNFLRNDKRPMWRAFSKDCKTMFWASEWPMLDAATRIVGHNTSNSPVTELWSHPEKGYRFMQTQENFLYSVKLEELAKGSDEPVDHRVKKIEGKKEPEKVVGYTGGYDPFNRGYSGGTTYSNYRREKPKETSTTHSTTSSTRTVKSKHSVVVTLPDPSVEPYGSFLTPERFAEIAKHGCSWCGKDLEWGDEGVTVWEKQGIINCAECSGSKTNAGSRIHLPNIDHIV